MRAKNNSCIVYHIRTYHSHLFAKTKKISLIYELRTHPPIKTIHSARCRLHFYCGWISQSFCAPTVCVRHWRKNSNSTLRLQIERLFYKHLGLKEKNLSDKLVLFVVQNHFRFLNKIKWASSFKIKSHK